MNSEDHNLKPKILCPNCGKPMRFVRAVPGIGALPELWVFECKTCAVSMTDTKADLMDRKVSA
jgi:hypothetical protein